MHCYVHHKVYGGWVTEEYVRDLIHDPLIGVVIARMLTNFYTRLNNSHYNRFNWLKTNKLI